MSANMFLCFVCIFMVSNVEGAEDVASTIDNHPAWDLLPSDCGRTRLDNLNKRIILGQEARLGQFPWMAMLGYAHPMYPEFPMFACAGAVINRHFVLSAAHCGDEELNMIRVGEHDVESEIDCDEDVCAPKPQDIFVSQFIHYPYDDKTHKGDIALYKLRKPIRFNDFVRPICLPRGALLTKDLVGRTVKMAGWGVTNSTTRDIASVLMYITAPIVNREECDKIFRHKLDESQLCAGYKSGQDTCSGDSGGPISRPEMVNGSRRNVVVGVVSYGRGNCGTGEAVYTNVAYYMKWVLDQISKR